MCGPDRLDVLNGAGRHGGGAAWFAAMTHGRGSPLQLQVHGFARGLMWLAVAASLNACAVPPPDDVATSAQALIHGDDDRRDLYAVEDAELRALATFSTAAAIAPERLFRCGSDCLELEAPNLRQSSALCEGEPFEEQPAAADCSAVLVDDDLLLTAGHCVPNAENCGDHDWVFGYAIAESSDPGARIRVRSDDTYRCRRVALRGYGVAQGGTRNDVALVQLDRPATPRRRVVTLEPAEVRSGDRVTVIGYPEGIPVKVDDGAVVLPEAMRDPNSFAISSDTFAGSSGSPVFDRELRLRGIVTRGGLDYERDAAHACFLARRVATGPAIDASSERAQYAQPVIDRLCESGWPSERLCGRGSTCGDGHCAVDEHEMRCPEDCPAIADLTEAALRAHGGAGCGVTMARTARVPGLFATGLLLLAAAALQRRVRP